MMIYPEEVMTKIQNTLNSLSLSFTSCKPTQNFTRVVMLLHDWIIWSDMLMLTTLGKTI